MPKQPRVISAGSVISAYFDSENDRYSDHDFVLANKVNPWWKFWRKKREHVLYVFDGR